MMFAALCLGGGAVGAWIFIAGLGKLAKSSRLRPSSRKVLGILLVLVAIVAAVLSFYGVFLLEVRGYPQWDRVALGSGTLALIAWGLFSVKRRWLGLYSIVEIASALVLAGFSFFNLPDSVEPIRLLGLITSIYFLVRGFENLEKSRQHRPNDSHIAPIRFSSRT